MLTLNVKTALSITHKLGRTIGSAMEHATRRPISTLTVIGSGLMGSGIAQVSAASGIKVRLVDTQQKSLDKAKVSLKTSLEKLAKKKFTDDSNKASAYVSDAMGRVEMLTSLEKAAENVDLIIEAVPENIKLKQDIFKQLDGVADQKTIFASNTSSLSIAEISELCERKDRFAGLHFFSPVPIMKLLEVVRVDGQTSDETFNTLMEFGKKIGKVPVACKDTPGFIVNRLLIPYMAEAFKMLERGDASAKDIDTAMKLGASYPMGPFELADFVGLDVNNAIIQGWAKKYPDSELFKPSKLLGDLVKEGRLGRKSGRGVHDYKELDAAAGSQKKK